MRRAFVVLLMLSLAALLIAGLSGVPTPEDRIGDSRVIGHILDEGVTDTGAVNLIAAVLFDYRGLDTLGEATVVFTCVAGLLLLLGTGGPRREGNSMSPLARRSVDILVPFIFLFGLIVIAHGHITPGGGFQGGVVLATCAIVICMVHGIDAPSPLLRLKLATAVESAGALAFVGIGLVGILAGAQFLTNLGAGFPAGRPGSLLSAGSIPFLNLAVGLKVGAGLTLIFCTMVRGPEP